MNVDKKERAYREGYKEGVRAAYLIGSIAGILKHLHELEKEPPYVGEPAKKKKRNPNAPST
jgi:hypothetical protein